MDEEKLFGLINSYVMSSNFVARHGLMFSNRLEVSHALEHHLKPPASPIASAYSCIYSKLWAYII